MEPRAAWRLRRSCRVSPNANAVDRLIKLVARLCSAPIALVSVATEQNHRILSSFGLPPGLDISADSLVLGETLLGGHVVVVPDITLADRPAEPWLLDDRVRGRFYAGVPLITSEGEAFGTLSVIDRKPRQLSTTERSSLELLGRQIVAPIELMLRLADLRFAAEERRRSQQALAESDAALHSVYTAMPMMMGIVEILGDDLRQLSGNAAAAAFFETASLAPSCALPGGAPPSSRGIPRTVLRLWLDRYRECIRDGSPIRFEYSHPTPDGARWLSVVVGPLPSPPGGPPRCCYIAEDATEALFFDLP